MRLFSILFLAGGIGIAFLLPAGIPSLENSYLLTAERVRQGYLLYRDLPAPLDGGHVLLYSALGSYGSYALRLWKVIGGIAALTFFRRSTLGSNYSYLAMNIWGTLYWLSPWEHPLEVGEPFLWLLLLLNQSTSYIFLRGILTGIGIVAFPGAIGAGLWGVYRRIEERAVGKLILWLLGIGWATLGCGALLHRIVGIGAYWQEYWRVAWSQVFASLEGSSFLSSIALLVLILQGNRYFYRPYIERRLYRDRVWACVASALLGNLGIGLALWIESQEKTFFRWLNLSLLGVGGFGWGHKALQRPTCELALPAYSCVWGDLPCYLTEVEAPYACDWTAPVAWRYSVRQHDWESFYDRWGNPEYIFDTEGFWAQVQYFLPHLSAFYVRKDTTFSIPSLRLYQRR